MGQQGGHLETKSAARRQSSAPAGPVLPTTPAAPALHEPTHEIPPAIAIEAAETRARLKNKGFTDEDIADFAAAIAKQER